MSISPPPMRAQHSSFSLAAWRPSLRGLLMIFGAFVLGLVLFLFIWMGQRGSTPVVPPTASTRSGPEFAPLPAPMPAEAAGASGLEEPDEDALAERPHIVETPRPPAEAAPPPASPVASAPAMAAATLPVPVSSPPPRYPSRAMRLRETGLVRVQVEVGVDGAPTSVSIAASSQSRDLDRAALDAVRRWRFRPAQRDGHPVAGTVVVPIDFRL